MLILNIHIYKEDKGVKIRLDLISDNNNAVQYDEARGLCCQIDPMSWPVFSCGKVQNYKKDIDFIAKINKSKIEFRQSAAVYQLPNDLCFMVDFFIELEEFFLRYIKYNDHTYGKKKNKLGKTSYILFNDSSIENHLPMKNNRFRKFTNFLHSDKEISIPKCLSKAIDDNETVINQFYTKLLKVCEELRDNEIINIISLFYQNKTEQNVNNKLQALIKVARMLTHKEEKNKINEILNNVLDELKTL